MPGIEAESDEKFLSREEILGADDSYFEDHYCAKWKGKVRIRTMTAADRDRFEFEYMQAVSEKRTPNIRALLVARCAVDPKTGERLFNDEDAETLAKKNGATIDELYGIAQRINVITEEDIQTLVKQSGASPDSASSSS